MAHLLTRNSRIEEDLIRQLSIRLRANGGLHAHLLCSRISAREGNVVADHPEYQPGKPWRG